MKGPIVGFFYAEKIYEKIIGEKFKFANNNKK